MIKDDIGELKNDVLARRDGLLLCNTKLKEENNTWNKSIITISLIGGFSESVKNMLNLDSAFFKLLPIAISSVTAIISALVKFKAYPERIERITMSVGLCDAVLTKIRNHTVIDDDIMSEYYNALQSVENAMTPQERKQFLVLSHKLLLEIMKEEQKYMTSIYKANKKHDALEDASTDTSSPSDTPRNEEMSMDNSSYKMFRTRSFSKREAEKIPDIETPVAPPTFDGNSEITESKLPPYLIPPLAKIEETKSDEGKTE